MFERLCRLYKDPRLFCYQKSFYKSTHQQPYLPSAGHLFAVLLGQVFEQPVSESWSSSTLSQSNFSPTLSSSLFLIPLAPSFSHLYKFQVKLFKFFFFFRCWGTKKNLNRRTMPSCSSQSKRNAENFKTNPLSFTNIFQ